VLIKDIFGLFIIITLYTIQLYFGIFSLSHPDNAFQVIELVTPLHIVPEWYFLLYYTMLKAIPNKNAGFIILLTSILILLLFGESHFRSLNCCFFLIIICFLWIGAQLPQEIFISYGRILTLFYYKIIIYLLFVILFHKCQVLLMFLVYIS
jgi:quinol-cytochrome oxidoreductase complex cytochrome b subunit